MSIYVFFSHKTEKSVINNMDLIQTEVKALTYPTFWLNSKCPLPPENGQNVRKKIVALGKFTPIKIHKFMEIS